MPLAAFAFERTTSLNSSSVRFIICVFPLNLGGLNRTHITIDYSINIPRQKKKYQIAYTGFMKMNKISVPAFIKNKLSLRNFLKPE
jgi:hypothetical protein